MHRTQLAYAKAKALADTLDAERKRRTPPMPANPTDADIDARVEADCAIETELGYWPAWEALHRAELAMLEWAAGTIKQNSPERWAQVAPVFATYNPTIRPKVIDLAFRLKA